MNRCTSTSRRGPGPAALRLALPLLAALLGACASRMQHQAPAPAPAPQAAAPTAAAPVPDKGDPEQRFQQALELMKAKKPQDAKDAFTKLSQDFPQYAGPLNDLGVLQADGKQRDQAIASFAKAVSVNSQDDFAYGWLGILYREAGNYPAAEQSYRKALALKPDNADTHLNLGILYDAYMRRPQDALAQYREYQRLAGKDSKLVVTAWINELQDNLPAAAPAAVAPAGGQKP